MKRLIGWFIFGAVLWSALDYFMPRDDTDPPGGRSGLVIRTDQRTGCQYLKDGGLFGGAMVPRMDASGKQICERATQ